MESLSPFWCMVFSSFLVLYQAPRCCLIFQVLSKSTKSTKSTKFSRSIKVNQNLQNDNFISCHVILGSFFWSIFDDMFVFLNLKEFLLLIPSEGLWFVPISFCSIVKIQSFAQFSVDHLFHLVVPSLLLLRCCFFAFVHNAINRFISFSAYYYYHIYQPFRSGRIWHEVSFLSGV